MLRLVSVEVLVYVLWLFQLQRPIVNAETECIPITLCPLATNLIKTKALAPETISFLRYNHCGFKGSEAKIWCNLNPPCLTPSSKIGTCTSVHKCKPFIKLLTKFNLQNRLTKKYLRAFQCSSNFDTEIRVCCPEESSSKESFPMNEFDEKHNNLLPNPKLMQCGQQSQSDKIFGGMRANLDEYPWLALLKYIEDGKEQIGCGGVLISEKYILTAAHCVNPFYIKQKNLGRLDSVVLGEYDLRTEKDCIHLKTGSYCAEPVQQIKVEKVIIHPENNKMQNDIALIRLSQKVLFTDFIHPICLPDKDMRLKGNETLTIAGWGKTETAQISSVKIRASVKPSPQKACNIAKNMLSETEICAGEGKGTDTCYGDSGGPLMLEKRLENDIVSVVIGITSYGFGNMCGVFPSVYVSVPHYIDWINSEIKL